MWVRQRAQRAQLRLGLQLILCMVGTAPSIGGEPPFPKTSGLLFKSSPTIYDIARLGPEYITSAVSDVAAADFDGDGLRDVAVAWYATNDDDLSANLRRLSILFNDRTCLVPGAEIDLYEPDYHFEAMSVFRIGTGSIAVGDFDGDGDQDLAVSAFFGDEIWLVENQGNRRFAQYVRFPFGFNSAGSFLTPPEMLAADFDADGRQELVYIADPLLQIGARTIHFWRTTSTIDHMQRVDWQGQGGICARWTRGLAVADFDADGRPDLCFTGTFPPEETSAILTFWYGLNLSQRTFRVHQEFPSIVCSDVVNVRPNPACPPGVLLTDRDGTTVQYWSHRCTPAVDFLLSSQITGYAGLSFNRGMTGVVADVDGDGDPDLVTKQKLGQPEDGNQIEIALCSDTLGNWVRVDPTPINTRGFANDPYNEILRPRNLVVADLFGCTLPEIVAGFGPSPILPTVQLTMETAVLQLAVWNNSCLGDVNRDGHTDAADLALLSAAIGGVPGPALNRDLDLDRDGSPGTGDVLILYHDFGCRCTPCAYIQIADCNCDGRVDLLDVDAFVVALSGQVAYQAAYPGCNWLNADCNGDGYVGLADIDPFLILVDALTPMPRATQPVPITRISSWPAT